MLSIDLMKPSGDSRPMEYQHPKNPALAYSSPSLGLVESGPFIRGGYSFVSGIDNLIYGAMT